jgi:hypothetical protein
MAAGQNEQPGADGLGEAGDADPALSRLAALQDRAADAYAAVTAADTELRAIAARRVAAERVLRRALLEPETGTPAAQAPPAEARLSLADARQAVAQLRDEFAARLAARAAAASTLRWLTAECAAARARISAGDKHSG